VPGLRKSFPLDLAGLTVAISAVAVIYGGFRAFYFQVGFLESFSYYSDERPFNTIVNQWIGRDPSETLVGIHAFGDYLLLNVWAQFPNPWEQPGGVNYLPPVVLLFKILGYLPYGLGLTLFLIALAVCILLPMVIASRGFPITQRLLFVTTLAVLTGPAIATLDRANNQGFLPILLFGFGIAVLKERWGWAAVCIALAACIKIYPILLILLLLALRKFSWAGVSVLLSAGVVLLTMPMTSNAGISGIPDVLEGVLDFQEKSVNQFLEYNTSLSGGLANALMFIGLDSAASWIALNAIVIIGIYALVVVPLLWIGAIPVWLRVILTLSLTTALMPITYPYALNWAIAAAAIAVWVSRQDSVQTFLSQRHSMLLALSLALLLAVLPVLIPGSAEASRAAGAASLASLATAILLPVTAFAVSRHRLRVVA